MSLGVLLTFLELLKAFKCDLELIWIAEIGRVVQDLDAQQGNDGHLEIGLLWGIRFVFGKTMLSRRV